MNNTITLGPLTQEETRVLAFALAVLVTGDLSTTDRETAHSLTNRIGALATAAGMELFSAVVVGEDRRAENEGAPALETGQPGSDGL